MSIKNVVMVMIYKIMDNKYALDEQMVLVLNMIG